MRKAILAHLLILFFSISPLCAASENDAAPRAALSPAGELPPTSAREQRAVAATRFGETFLAADAQESQRTIQVIINDIKVVEKKYLENLEDGRSSHGLFAVGSSAYDTQNDETRAGIGLEFRLFNDGYFEAVRRDSEKMLQAQLEFYQMQQDMIGRKLDEDLYFLARIENRLNLDYHQEKTAALAVLLDKRRRQLAHGYTTALDIGNLERQLRDQQSTVDFYRTIEHDRLGRQLRDFLNRIERVHLKPIKDLSDAVQARSPQLRIQDNFVARSEFLPSWSDQIAVNFEAGYNQEYSERERHFIGVRVEVPLTLDSDRSSLVETQKRIYRLQKEAVGRRLMQQLKQLCSFFGFQQQRLLAQQDTLEFLLHTREVDSAKESDSLQKFADDPTRSLELLELQIIDARYEAMRIRLKLYEVVLKLLALTQSAEITELFEIR